MSLEKILLWRRIDSEPIGEFVRGLVQYQAALDISVVSAEEIGLNNNCVKSEVFEGKILKMTSGRKGRLFISDLIWCESIPANRFEFGLPSNGDYIYVENSGINYLALERMFCEKHLAIECGFNLSEFMESVADKAEMILNKDASGEALIPSSPFHWSRLES